MQEKDLIKSQQLVFFVWGICNLLCSFGMKLQFAVDPSRSSGKAWNVFPHWCFLIKANKNSTSDFFKLSEKH